MTAEERQLATQALAAEYGLLMAALGAAWSASLVRTSIFLAVLSAAGIALGFAAQGGVGTPAFTTLALVVLPLVLFLGIATFVRVVEVQREAMVYLTGLNRIRYFFQQGAPASKPYYVLPAHDDAIGLRRSIGTGMHRQPPRSSVLEYVSQTQGIVGVVTAVVAAAFAGLAASGAGETVAWIVAALAFVVTLAALFRYWGRSLAEIRTVVRPLHPTPPDEMDAPI
jgi:hypothetical protein